MGWNSESLQTLHHKFGGALHHLGGIYFPLHTGPGAATLRGLHAPPSTQMTPQNHDYIPYCRIRGRARADHTKHDCGREEKDNVAENEPPCWPFNCQMISLASFLSIARLRQLAL